MVEAKVLLTADCLAEYSAQMTDIQWAQRLAHQLGHEMGLCSAAVREWLSVHSTADQMVCCSAPQRVDLTDSMRAQLKVGRWAHSTETM